MSDYPQGVCLFSADLMHTVGVSLLGRKEATEEGICSRGVDASPTVFDQQSSLCTI